MYIAMNRFTVASSEEATFEKVWQDRESHLDQMDGFLSFKMLKGESVDGKTLYSSHVEWREKSCFDAWIHSDEFKASHGKSKMPSGVILGPPKFEGFEVVLTK